MTAMSEKLKDLSHGIIGTAMPAVGVGVSLSTLETWLRITSLLVGIAVGGVTLRKLLKR
jgi:hypothetical protein